jgi:hypothetical protein
MKALTSAVVVLAANGASALPPDMLKVLPGLLAKGMNLQASAFEAKKDKKQWEVAFCPDNTCQVIYAPATTPAAAMGDFTLLYLYYASGYIYLKNFYLTDAKPYIPGVLARSAPQCGQGPELVRASCALSALADKHNIRLASRIYDEGEIGEAPTEARNELSEPKLKEIKSWQMDAWKYYQ